MPVYIIGNWKMQLTEAESVALAREAVRLWSGQGATRPQVKAIICPSHIALKAVGEIVKGTSVAMGSQDVFWEEKGAYTGEIAPRTLKELGCEYCLVGHSERRQYLGETDEMVNKKVLALLMAGISPVICLGETRDERDAGRRDSVVIGQLRAALKGVELVGTHRLLVAYEPRWAIGTGVPVSPDDAASMHQLIRDTLLGTFGSDVTDRQTAVIYGGAVDNKNIASFLAVPLIDGALVGGASLRPADYVSICEQSAEARKY